jgi:prepilin peptidase CpaA
MRLDLIALIPALAYAVLLLTAAVYDWIWRRIPNWTVIALILLFIPVTYMGLTPTTWPWSLAAFVLALAISGALYLLGWVGAGDSKLFAAVALFAGLSNLALLGSATALVGGVMAIVVLIMHPRRAMSGLTTRGRADGKSRGIPYGVAIAAGALITGYFTGFTAPHYKLHHIELPSAPTAAAQGAPAAR